MTAPQSIRISDAAVARIVGLLSQARETPRVERDEFDEAPLTEPAPPAEVTKARIETLLAMPDDAEAVLAAERGVRVEARS